VHLKYNTLESANTTHATFYSDGFAIGSNLPRISRLVLCPVCNEVFFYDEQEINPVFKSEDICMDALAPSMDRFLELLANTGKLSMENEIYLRKEIWYFGTHHPIGSDEMLNNPSFKMQWIENLEKLEELLQTDNPEHVLLKAEVNRHLGRFTRCLELLTNNNLTACDIKFVRTLRKKATKGNTEVFET
jgi:hypothetical protein